MDLGLGVIFLIVGIVVARKQELRLSSSWISKGRPARLAGVLLILALPAILVFYVAFGIVKGYHDALVLYDFPRLPAYSILVVIGMAAFLVARRGTRQA